MHRRLANYTFILGTALLLSACGFALRGTGDTGTNIPPEWKNMHLVTDNPNSEFSRDVLSRFAANGVEWQERGAANYNVTLGPERFSQRNLSLNAEARAAEFELTMRAQFSVQDAEGNEVMKPSDVTAIKQMENDPRNVVGKAEEIRLVKGEMRAELAQQIMRRIGFFAASAQ
jgi:LPS-assembly lipoprotein